MGKTALIAGGGIGGLAAAFALGRAGWGVQLFERAAEFSEVGAGIQMGPNVTRVLDGWGLTEALNQVAAFPSHLQVRNASSGRELVCCHWATHPSALWRTLRHYPPRRYSGLAVDSGASNRPQPNCGWTVNWPVSSRTSNACWSAPVKVQVLKVTCWWALTACGAPCGNGC